MNVWDGELDQRIEQLNKRMGFFSSGDSSMSSTVRRDPSQDFSVTRPAAAPPKVVAVKKEAVKIGSLPKVPAWLMHVSLAIAAAGIVHLIVYYYAR